MKVAYVGGYWSTNIGNAFFNLGAEYVLKEVFGRNNVHMVFDHPSGIFRSQKGKGNPKRSFNMIENLIVDMVVILGPVISRDFLKTWGPTLLKLKERGVKYSIFSCGLMKYDEKVLQEVGAFFSNTPPSLITTRDIDAFEKLSPFVSKIYNGIDFAFFVPDIHYPADINIKKTVALNFDKFYEPKIKISTSLSKSTFTFDNREWLLKFNKFFMGLGKTTDRFTDALIYLFSVFPAKDRPTKIDEYTFIRPDHRFTPILKNKVFRYSNSFVSDIPESYLDIYATSVLTLSDRVHACVASLAYGNHAMFFSRTSRSKLLDRVGATEIREKPVKIDLNKLKIEKDNLIEWIKKEIRNI